MVKLKGITWAHSRGYTPVVATAQRFQELYPEIQVEWDMRSLQDFGGAPIDDLANRYDLIVLDHPWMGFADANHVLEPLENWLPNTFIKNQEENTVGKSFQSYLYNGHLYGLAIDAACPISFYSPKKMEAFGGSVPKTWAEVLELAKKGGVLCSGNGTSLLMQFYMLCVTKTDDVFTTEKIADKAIMIESLQEIKELFSYLDPIVFEKNPIGIYELLATSEHKAFYTPCDFGYSNYSRKGYSKELILSADTPIYHNGKQLRTILGGAGLAVSAQCKHKEEAARYAAFTASEQSQSCIYVESAGQSGHRAAWEGETANIITNNFFKNTLKTLDNAYLRPQHNGYLAFQEPACEAIHELIKKDGDIEAFVEHITQMYIKSFK